MVGYRSVILFHTACPSAYYLEQSQIYVIMAKKSYFLVTGFTLQQHCTGYMVTSQLYWWRKTIVASQSQTGT